MVTVGQIGHFWEMVPDAHTTIVQSSICNDCADDYGQMKLHIVCVVSSDHVPDEVDCIFLVHAVTLSIEIPQLVSLPDFVGANEKKCYVR